MLAPESLPFEIHLDSLTESEQDAIYEVLRRDMELRRQESVRIRNLRSDVNKLQNMVNKSEALENSEKFCSLCHVEFGWLFNRGDACPKCEAKVCDKCRDVVKTKQKWICSLCFKQIDLKARSGAWFYSKFRRSRRKQRGAGASARREDTPNPFGRSRIQNAGSDGEEGNDKDLDLVKEEISESEGGSHHLDSVIYPVDSDRRLLAELLGTTYSTSFDSGSEAGSVLDHQVPLLAPENSRNLRRPGFDTAQTAQTRNEANEIVQNSGDKQAQRLKNSQLRESKQTRVSRDSSSDSETESAPATKESKDEVDLAIRRPELKSSGQKMPVAQSLRTTSPSSPKTDHVSPSQTFQKTRSPDEQRSILPSSSRQPSNVVLKNDSSVSVDHARADKLPNIQTVKQTNIQTNKHNDQNRSVRVSSSSVDKNVHDRTDSQNSFKPPDVKITSPKNLDVSKGASRTAAAQPAAKQIIDDFADDYSDYEDNSLSAISEENEAELNSQDNQRLSMGTDLDHFVSIHNQYELDRLITQLANDEISISSASRFRRDDSFDRIVEHNRKMLLEKFGINFHKPNDQVKSICAEAESKKMVEKTSTGSVHAENLRGEKLQSKTTGLGEVQNSSKKSDEVKANKQFCSDTKGISGKQSSSDKKEVSGERTFSSGTKEISHKQFSLESEEGSNHSPVKDKTKSDVVKKHVDTRMFMSPQHERSVKSGDASSKDCFSTSVDFTHSSTPSDSLSHLVSTEVELFGVDAPENLESEISASATYNEVFLSEFDSEANLTDICGKQKNEVLHDHREISDDSSAESLDLESPDKSKNIDPQAVRTQLGFGSRTPNVNDSSVNAQAESHLWKKIVLTEARKSENARVSELNNNKTRATPSYSEMKSKEHNVQHQSQEIQSDTSSDDDKNIDLIKPLAVTAVHSGQSTGISGPAKGTEVVSPLGKDAGKQVSRVVLATEQPDSSDSGSDDDQRKIVDHKGRDLKQRKHSDDAASVKNASALIVAAGLAHSATDNVENNNASVDMKTKKSNDSGSADAKNVKSKETGDTQSIPTANKGFRKKIFGLAATKKVTQSPSVSENTKKPAGVSANVADEDVFEFEKLSQSNSIPALDASVAADVAIVSGATCHVTSLSLVDVSQAPQSCAPAGRSDSTDDSHSGESHSSESLKMAGKVTSSVIVSQKVQEGDRNSAEEVDDFESDAFLDFVKTSESLSHRRSLSHVPAISQESIVSMYSNPGRGRLGRIPVTGEIEFSVKYNDGLSAVEVFVRQCRGLAVADTKKRRTNPYVKTYLLPDKNKSSKRKTKVKKNTVDPTFNEAIRYVVGKKDLEKHSLWISVWHNDRFGRNEFLGDVALPLNEEALKDPEPRWHSLEQQAGLKWKSLLNLTSKADLDVALKYVTADRAVGRLKGKQKKPFGEVILTVKKARNLNALQESSHCNTFCQCRFLPEQPQHTKQKTRVVRQNVSPTWNHSFVFTNVAFENLIDSGLELTVFNSDLLKGNSFLGGLRLNLGAMPGKSFGKDWMDASGEEISLWKNMMERPNEWIEGTVQLRSYME